jgi:hypothetical protein
MPLVGSNDPKSFAWNMLFDEVLCEVNELDLSSLDLLYSVLTGDDEELQKGINDASFVANDGASFLAAIEETASHAPLIPVEPFWTQLNETAHQVVERVFRRVEDKVKQFNSTEQHEFAEGIIRHARSDIVSCLQDSH